MATINITINGNDEENIFSQLKQIQMTQEELKQELETLTLQTEKAKEEVIQKIADLEAAIVAAGNVTEPVLEALNSLKGSVQAVDDINPDA